MRIAVIRRKYDPQGGGAERYAAYVIDKLISRGHDITVFAEKYYNVPNNVNIIPVKRPFLPTLCRTATFAKSAKKVVDNSLFDVVFALSRYEGADVYRQAEQLHAVWLPIYYSYFSRFNPRHSGILALEKRVFNDKSTGTVITNSELVRNQVIDIFNFDSKRVKVIRNGVDRNKFHKAESLEEKFSIREELLGADKKSLALLFIAGNFAIKGLDKAIIALANIQDADVKKNTKLIVVGGDNPLPYKELAEKNGVASNLIFMGEQHDMRRFYIASDMLLYPSLYEPFANVCLEACACGLPVLTTAQNGSSELIKHGSNGYLIDSAEDTDTMAQLIQKYSKLSNEEKDAMSTRAFEATDGYSWESHVEQLELIFNDVKQKKSL